MTINEYLAHDKEIMQTDSEAAALPIPSFHLLFLSGLSCPSAILIKVDVLMISELNIRVLS
jgi:hypothetical protein